MSRHILVEISVEILVEISVEYSDVHEASVVIEEHPAKVMESKRPERIPILVNQFFNPSSQERTFSALPGFTPAIIVNPFAGVFGITEPCIPGSAPFVHPRQRKCHLVSSRFPFDSFSRHPVE